MIISNYNYNEKKMFKMFEILLFIKAFEIVHKLIFI